MWADSRQEGKPLPHMWSKCVGAGRACEGLRREWVRQLKEAVSECGFEYIRFHGLLAEDMFVVREVSGKLQYNWYYIDQIFDALQEIGIRPIVELGFMPPALASGNGTQFWWKGNVTPPKDIQAWEELVRALVLHFVERYGLSEVRNWYFEVWNEPDLHAFWNGTKSQYFELYQVSVRAVKSVDASLKVGGPATSNFVPDERFDGEVEDTSKHMTHKTEDLDSLSWKGVWIEDFLNFCEKKGLPVDFVSTHPYPTDFALDGQQHMKGSSRHVNSLRDDMQWLKNRVEQSAYPNAELHLTEWSSSPTSRDYSHDYLPAADYIVKSNLDNTGRADSLSYWVFTDIFEEAGGGPEAFHGGFGMMNVHGIKKPSYWAYYFLNCLGEEELAREDEGIVTRSKDGKLQALFYNYAKELRQAVPIAGYPHYERAEAIQDMGQERVQQVYLKGLLAGAIFRISTLDKEHSSAELWKKMGYPKNLTKQQEHALKEVSPALSFATADENGELNLSIRLLPWSIVLLEQV